MTNEPNPAIAAQPGLTITANELERCVRIVVDYRGDVTITRNDGSTIVGYVFEGTTSRLSVMAADDDAKLDIPIADIASVTFTGRDTAEGKSFDTWVKKYVERKLAGEPASIDP